LWGKVDPAQQFTAALIDGSLRAVIAERVSITGIAPAHELGGGASTGE
jgi:hypothetical protein